MTPGAMVAMCDGAPFVEGERLPNYDWELQWRLNYGGMLPFHRLRLDDPDHKFGWRGTTMEKAFANAAVEVFPKGSCNAVLQPMPTAIPDGAVWDWRRADVALEFSNLRRMVFDVGTKNVVGATGLKAGLVKTQMDAFAHEKVRTYRAYYEDFSPFIISLNGGVTSSSRAALRLIAKWANASSTEGGVREAWEPELWVEQIHRRMAFAMARVAGWAACQARAEEAIPYARILPRARGGG